MHALSARHAVAGPGRDRRLARRNPGAGNEVIPPTILKVLQPPSSRASVTTTPGQSTRSLISAEDVRAGRRSISVNADEPRHRPALTFNPKVARSRLARPTWSEVFIGPVPLRIPAYPELERSLGGPLGLDSQRFVGNTTETPLSTVLMARTVGSCRGAFSGVRPILEVCDGHFWTTG